MAGIALKIRKFLLFFLINLGIIFIILVLCEGLAGVILFSQALRQTPPVAERQHTQYDEKLGWVNKPGVFIKDMYGPGLDMQINSQGFRSKEEFSQAIPAGKIRLICSGDSFTLGYGVGNDDTWCQALTALDSRLQTVNMGQGGYGVDQAYLWYKQDGVKLDHNVHLFAFITTDFERMQQTEFLGYGKPRLFFDYEQLQVANVPVPQRAFYVPWLTQNYQALQQLSLVRLLQQNAAGQPQPAQAAPASTAYDPEVVAAAILRDLLATNEMKNSTLVLVYLPTLGDYQPETPGPTDRWRNFVKVAAQDTDAVFIDVVEAFRQLPPDQVPQLFIAEGAVDFPGAAGHYTVAGNRYVAEVIYEQLMTLPQITPKLDQVN